MCPLCVMEDMMAISTQGIFVEKDTLYYCTISDNRVVICGSETITHDPMFAIMNRKIDETVDQVLYDHALDERYFMRENFQPVDCKISSFAMMVGMCMPLIRPGCIVVTDPDNAKNPAFWLAMYGQVLRLMVLK